MFEVFFYILEKENVNDLKNLSFYEALKQK